MLDRIVVKPSVRRRVAMWSVAALILGCLVLRYRQIETQFETQEEAVAKVAALGGRVIRRSTVRLRDAWVVEVDLSGTGIRDADMPILSSFPYLQRVDLRETNISRRKLQELGVSFSDISIVAE